MKILETNIRTLVVYQNADGSLLITEKGLPIKNAGNFILNFGGIDAVLAKCKDMTEEEFLAEKKNKLEKQKAKQDYLLTNYTALSQHGEANLYESERFYTKDRKNNRLYFHY